MDNYNKPAELVQIYINSSITKAGMPPRRLIALALLAGAYIAFGAEFCTVAGTGTVETLGFGASKFLGGAAFSLGLMLVVVCGGELFTGNCLMVTALPEKKITMGGMLYNWITVYLSNFAGALIFALIVCYGGTWMQAGNGLGETALNIAAGKCSLTFAEALLRGIGCNWLVCLGVWMGLAGRDIAGKVFGIFFPIAAFVAMGFEHCVANMYFIPKALILKGMPQLADYVAGSEIITNNLTLSNFIAGNLIPVTIGNIIGGALFVGMLYYAAYRKPAAK